MKEQFSRTAMLLGEEAVQKLQESCVAVFGLGGVGSYCVEALARSGVGKLILIDHDTVAESNLNRQLFALHDTIGRKKTEAARERIRQINPDCIVEVRDVFFLPETKDSFDFTAYGYVARKKPASR